MGLELQDATPRQWTGEKSIRKDTNRIPETVSLGKTSKRGVAKKKRRYGFFLE